MRKIRIADVANYAYVDVDGTRHHIEVELPRPALRLQVIARQLEGAADTDLLMADESNKPYAHRNLTRAITDPATEVGVAPTNGQVVRRTVNPDHWARARGISLQPL